jgi:predicted GNAT family acetyltransferase
MRAHEFVTENIQLQHEPTETGGVEIHAYRDGQEVGWVRFAKLRTGQYKAAMVHVPERLRRQGIGTAMYLYARQELGLNIVPSDSQTDLGRAFWNKQQAQDQQLAERKKRRKQSRWAFSGPGGWYGYYYGGSGENSGDGGGGESVEENFADGKVKGKSRPGRVKRSGASCSGSVTDLRARAKKYGGERGRMYHWCANMKSGRKK